MDRECEQCIKNKKKIIIDLDIILDIFIYVAFIGFLVICICSLFGNEDCMKFLKSMSHNCSCNK